MCLKVVIKKEYIYKSYIFYYIFIVNMLLKQFVGVNYNKCEQTHVLYKYAHIK